MGRNSSISLQLNVVRNGVCREAVLHGLGNRRDELETELHTESIANFATEKLHFTCFFGGNINGKSDIRNFL